MKPDLVYILGKGSVWDNNELRFSLRSVEEHVVGFGRVFLVGEKPYFINNNVIHIPLEDPSKNQAFNIAIKVYNACLDKRLSEEFVLMNDDYFIMNPIDLTRYPFYYKAELKQTLKINRSNTYGRHVQESIRLMEELGIPLKNFDVHKPIRLKKHKVIELLDKLDFFEWRHQRFGCILKSLYCNYYGCLPEYVDDSKVNRMHKEYNWERITKRLDCLSIGDLAVDNELKKFLYKQFPNKSKYESD